MINDSATSDFPKGSRDTRNWYLDVDPLAIVDQSLVDYVLAHGGQNLLDLGCGTGGYARLIEAQGRNVVALDVNEQYVAVARGLGVKATQYDGVRIPLPDKSVDTIYMIEVLEHIHNPIALLPELKRVARRNIILTVPNCTQEFHSQVVFHHMLDVDHKNFFTVDSLHKLLSLEFSNILIEQVAPVDFNLAKELLPRWLFRVWRKAYQYRVIKDRFFFRLIANVQL